MNSCLFFFLVSLFSSIGAVEPTGLKIRVTNRAQDVLKNLSLVFLEDLVNRSFPDVSMDIGFFNLIVRGFTFTLLKVDPAQFDLQFQEDSGLQLEIKDLEFTVKLQRDINLPLIKDFSIDSRAATITGSGVSASVTVVLNQNQHKRLNVEIPDGSTNCRITAESISVQSSGFLGSLWDLLRPAAQFYFNKMLCPALQTYVIPKLNSVSESITTTTALNELLNISIDYSLNGDVAVTSRSLDFPFKIFSVSEALNIRATVMEVAQGLVWQGDTVDSGSITGPDPVLNETDSMVYVGISEFFFNSAVVSIYESGPFQLNISKLNESDVGLQEIPKGLCQVTLTEAPIIGINKSGLCLDAKATVQSLTETSLPPATVICHFDVMVKLEENHLILVSQHARYIFQSESHIGTNVGLVDVELYDSITNFFQKWFGKGIPIPLPVGLNFNQEKITCHHGFVVAAGSLDFTRHAFVTVVNLLTGHGSSTTIVLQ